MKTERITESKGVRVVIIMPLLALLFISTLIVSCGGGAAGKSEEEQRTEQQAEKIEIEQTIEISESILINSGADTIKMGHIPAGGVKSKRIEIVNAGDKPFVILNIDKTCGCVDFDYPRKPMKAGERFETDMIFDSKGENGRVFKTVSITTSLGTKPFLLVVMAEIE